MSEALKSPEKLFEADLELMEHSKDLLHFRKVVIGKEGVINGKVNCTYADVEGKFTGNIEVKESLSLKSSSIIEGEVVIGNSS